MKKILSLLLLLVLLSGFLLTSCAGREALSITRPEDIASCRIGVTVGTTHDSFVMENFPEAKISRFNVLSDMKQALLSYKIDAAVLDRSTAYIITSKTPELTVMDELLFEEEFGVAFNQSKTELCAQYNQFLAEIKNSGVYDEMDKRWQPGDETIEVPPIENKGSKGTLRLAVEAETGMPFVSKREDKFIGFDIEMMERFAASLDMKLQIDAYDFNGLLAACVSGKSDMVASAITITEERKKQVLFSDTYFVSGGGVMLRKEDAGEQSGLLKTVDDLGGQRIGTLTGSVQELYIADRFPTAAIVRFDNTSDMPAALKSGQIDAIAFPYYQMRELQKNDESLAFLSEKIFEKPTGHAFNKKDPALLAEFNAFMAQIKADGTYDDIFKRYFTDGVYDMPDIPVENPKGVYRLGATMTVGLPFVAVKDGESVGFDIEIAKRFAASKGLALEVEDITFSGLVAALASGKVESIAGSIAITPERQEKVSFSDVMYMNPTAVLTTKAKMTGQSNAQGSGNFFTDITNEFHKNIIAEKRYMMIVNGVLTTALISLCSLILGTLLAMLICSMRMSRFRVLSEIAKVYINVLRGVPVVVVLMIIFYVIFARISISPMLVAILGFGLNFSAYGAEIFRSGIDGVDRGQWEAGVAGGFTRGQTFSHIVLPQALRSILPIYKGEFISLVKTTSIAGYIAVEDLTKAGDIIRSRTFSAFFPLLFIAILYFLISWLLTRLLSMIELRIDPRRKRDKARREAQKERGGAKHD